MKIYRFIDMLYFVQILNDQAPMGLAETGYYFPAEYEMMDYKNLQSSNINNLNPIHNINISNLSSNEKIKLMNITNLQNQIQNTETNFSTTNSIKETRGEMNFRRELTDREKVELEMKKWKKAEQKKVRNL